MKAVVICEDHTLDEYVVKPVVENIFRELGKRCRVTVASNPRVKGVDQALSADLLQHVFSNYRAADVFFLIVDRDGDEQRESGKLEECRRDAEKAGKALITCLAIEEVEVWALAIHREKLAKDFKKKVQTH
jgi:hypothetical protein